MGIASRTKWERRVNMPISAVRHIDPAKLAHAARLAHESRSDKAWASMLAENIMTRHSEACAEIEAKRQRRRKAHKARNKRGWRPYAQR